MAQRDEDSATSRVIEAFLAYGFLNVTEDGEIVKRTHYDQVMSTAIQCFVKTENRAWSADPQRAFSEQFKERIVPLMRFEDTRRQGEDEEDDWEFGIHIVNLLIVSLRLRPGFLEADIPGFLRLLQHYVPAVYHTLNVALYDGGTSLIAVSPEEENVAESMRELKEAFDKSFDSPEDEREKEALLGARLGYACVLPQEGEVCTRVDFQLVLTSQDKDEKGEPLVQERKDLFGYFCAGLSSGSLRPYAEKRAQQLTDGLRPYFLPEHFATFRVEATFESREHI